MTGILAVLVISGVARAETAASPDAAAIYRQAAQATRAFSPAGSNLEYPGYPPYGAEWTRMADESFEKNQEALELVHKARSIARANWGDDKELKLWNSLRNLTNIIGDAALTQHFRGDDRAAFETLRDLDHLVLLMRQDIKPDQKWRALVGVGLDALECYRVMTIAADLQIADGPGDTKRLGADDVAAFIKLLMDMPPAEPVLAKIGDWGKEVAVDVSTGEAARSREQGNRVDAERGMAAMSLACQLFRKDKGRWPANLNKLSTKLPRPVPVDPWGDGKQTLGYALIKKGLPDGGDRPLVYSRCRSQDGLIYRIDEPQLSFYNGDGTDSPVAQRKNGGQFRDATLWKPQLRKSGAPTTRALE
jgi:hypothetical protein